jgi:opine dehydrogenase
MRVAILGTGGIGRSYAAYMAASGHVPVLWSPTGSGLAAPGCDLVATGVVAATQPVAVASECAEAVEGAEIVLVAVTGNGLHATLRALAPVLVDGQLVIISAHLSFAALTLSRLIAARGVQVTIAAWATTALTGRRGAGSSVHISGKRARLDVAALPVERAGMALSGCQALFGDAFDLRPDLLAIMLSNLNPPAHMANMLCNLTRAEKGEVWVNYAGFTPAVTRLIEALDRERLRLAGAFGLQVRSIEDHFVASFNVTRAPLAEMAAIVAGRRQELKGPATLDTRFVTEDVPFGLLPLVLLGRVAECPMPLHEAGIAMFSALYGRDFQGENDLLPDLALERLTKQQVHDAMRHG